MIKKDSVKKTEKGDNKILIHLKKFAPNCTNHRFARKGEDKYQNEVN